MENHTIIIGAGQAGLQAAETLRAQKYVGKITLLGNETDGPYHRPPLSKTILTGEQAPEQLLMRTQTALDRKQIELRTKCSVITIDTDNRILRLNYDEPLSYSNLILATGASPRQLPNQSGCNEAIHVLRSREHAISVASRLRFCQERQRSVVVIGGGFIGLEVAAVGRRMGLDVTVLEAGSHLIGRIATPALANFYRQQHAAQGVQIKLNALVTALANNEHGDVVVHLADGERLVAGLALVAIGINPNDELARNAGIHCDHGIIVDDCGRTSAPNVVAAGDCTARRLEDGSLLRLESVQNAIEQGKSAAYALLGQNRPFSEIPYFWSEQYDLKLQIAGVASDITSSIVRGQASKDGFSIYHFSNDRLVSVDTINSTKEHLLSRKLLKAGVSPTPTQVRDVNFNLATLLS